MCVCVTQKLILQPTSCALKDKKKEDFEKEVIDLIQDIID